MPGTKKRPPVPCNRFTPRATYDGVLYECDGWQHQRGGQAHSAITPKGRFIWWEYAGGRVEKRILRGKE